jgi:hypothetical protein
LRSCPLQQEDDFSHFSPPPRAEGEYAVVMRHIYKTPSTRWHQYPQEEKTLPKSVFCLLEKKEEKEEERTRYTGD